MTDDSRVDISLVILATGVRPDLGLFREMMETYRRELDALERSYEVLIVDDGVGGPFFQAVLALKQRWPDLRALQFRRGFGESVALGVAVSHARGRYVVTSTWYLQVDPAGIRRAVELLDSGVDYVTGMRNPRVDGLLARFQSWTFNACTRWLTKVRLHDLNCSFRAFKREVVEELTFHGDLFRFLGILAVQHGFRVQEMEIRHLREEGPTTWWSLGLVIRRLLDILALFFLIKFTRKPLRFFGMVGSLFFLAGTTVCGYMAYRKIVDDMGLADKPMLILGIFLIVLGIIVASIGLIGEIIIFTLGKNIRDYHIDRMIEGGVTQAEPAIGGPGKLTVGLLSPYHEERWSEYVNAHQDATLFHELIWRDVMLDTFSHPARYLVAFRSGRMVGVLPLMIIRSMFFGRSAISAPFGVYGGILADDAEVAGRLADAARQVGRDEGAKYVELRHVSPPPGLEPLPTSDLYCTFIRDLPSDPDECLNMLPRKARAEARKARANTALEVRCDAMALEEFHRLFVDNKRKLGSPPFPMSLFWHLKEHYGDRVNILSVHHEGEAVAAVMNFFFRDTYMAYYSGAVEGANRLSANNLMYVAAMEDAVRRGFKRFDFGRSRIGTGSYSFKKNQGFEPIPLHYQYLLDEGQELPSINASNPKYEIGKKVFRILPQFAAQRLGSFVAKRMPV